MPQKPGFFKLGSNLLQSGVVERKERIYKKKFPAQCYFDF